MKNKLKLLIKDGLNKKINTKWFKVVNIILLVVIVGLINIDNIIKFFGGNFDDPIVIYVIDNTNKYYEAIKSGYDNIDLSALGSESEIKLADKSLDELKEEMVNDESNDIILVINSNNGKVVADVISYNYVDAVTLQVLNSTLSSVKTNIALMESSLTEEELASIYEPVEINRSYLSDNLDENNELMSYIGNFIIPMFIIPFFLLIIMVTQMIGAEINEEKSSKSMEIIITSVPARLHFISKIITANVYAILQSLLFVLYFGVGLLIRRLVTGSSLISSLDSQIGNVVNQFIQSGTLDNLLKCLPVTIIMILLSFVAYSLIAGILASMTTNQEDFQQLQSPMMMIIMAGYFLAILASTYEKSTFITTVSVIPFISCILSPVLLMMGQIGIVHVLISILLLILTLYLLIKYGLRVYKVGILNYSSSNLWKKILEGIKSKE